MGPALNGWIATLPIGVEIIALVVIAAIVLLIASVLWSTDSSS